MMSANAPPLILISSTMPSKVDSMLNRFWKVTRPPAGATMVGLTNSVLPMLVSSGANASLGALTGLVVEVTHATSIPVAAVVHPAGSAGATTPSKFSENVAGHGVGVGVTVGVATGVGDAPPPPQLPLTSNTMCMPGNPSAAVVVGVVTPQSAAL